MTRTLRSAPRPPGTVPGWPVPGWLVQAVLGAGLLGGSWVAVHRPALQRVDVRLGDTARVAGTPVLDRVVAGTTDLGSLYGVLGASAALAAAGRGTVAADVLGVGAGAWVLAQTNKRFVRRQRPYEAEGTRRLIRAPTGSSFPSGHAAVGLATMFAVAEHARTRGAAVALRAVGAYVAASRVYVGVHYPTDVVGGAGLGLLVAALWRGPVALVGRRGVALAAGVSQRLGSPPGRASALGARRDRRRDAGAVDPPQRAAV